jgi:hypothetical protein
MKLITHLCLMQNLRMFGAVPSLPQPDSWGTDQFSTGTFLLRGMKCQENGENFITKSFIITLHLLLLGWGTRGAWDEQDMQNTNKVRNVCRILAGKLEERKRRRIVNGRIICTIWTEENTYTVSRTMWTQLDWAQNKARWRARVTTVLNLRIP